MQLKHFLQHLGAHRFSPESIEMALNRVSFYADDLSLCVSMSISKTLDILQSFGSFSGYKLNINQSECFSVNKVAKQIPEKILSFQLVSASFQNLGVNISDSLPSFLYHNILKLVNEVNSGHQHWDALPLSLLGRINSTRMDVLPWFLFLCKCLIVFHPLSCFKVYIIYTHTKVMRGKWEKRLFFSPTLMTLEQVLESFARTVFLNSYNCFS